jgi:hypothetical protein
MDDQPLPGDAPEISDELCCVELTAPGGQMVALLFIQRVPIHDLVLTVLPTFRKQSGMQGPIGFKMRAMSAAELDALREMQEAQATPPEPTTGP